MDRRQFAKAAVVFLLVFVVAAMSDIAAAQPLFKTHLTVEAMIAQAEFVAIGKIIKAEEVAVVGAEPMNPFRGRLEKGKFVYELSTQFDKVLKRVDKAGEGGEFKKLKTIDPQSGRVKEFAEWTKNETAGLWLIQSAYESESFRRWQFIPFEGQGRDHFGYTASSLKPPMFASNLSYLKTKKEILARIKEYAPISQMQHDPEKIRVASIRIPHGMLGERFTGENNIVVIPIDSGTPITARRLIESTHEYPLSNHVRLDKYAYDDLRIAGIELLGKLPKNESNVKLLRDCLDESIVPFKNGSNPNRVRSKAYERLLDWRVNPPKPSFGASISTLFLSETDVNDDSMKLLSELENLEELFLWETAISHKGIEHLGKLKNLRLLELDDAVLTNEMLETLKTNDQLHAIAQATTKSYSERPRSANDVVRLEFWCASFDDDGLNALAIFQNLTIINLGRMDITDAAIDHLLKFKKLRKAVLRETKISDEGFAKLRKALPKCKIEG